MNWKTISPHFTPSEIFSPDILRANALHLVDIYALQKLNRMREILDAPCYVNHQRFLLRGVVSPREALNRGGAPLTMHVTGKAFDVSCYKVSIDELADAMKEAGFITVYKYSSWCHGDMAVRGGIIL
jgi:uncharacterized protein YcbK (DUF882 family)